MHDREFCRDCYVDYGPINREAEVKAGLLKAPTEIEALVAERAAAIRGFDIVRKEELDPKCLLSESGFYTNMVKNRLLKKN